MELHKAAWRQHNITRSSLLIVYDAVFPNGFAPFMEAMVREGLVNEQYGREPGAIGYRWCDERANGGLLIETCNHPMVGGRAGTVIFEGIKESLEIAHATLNAQNVQYSKIEYK